MPKKKFSEELKNSKKKSVLWSFEWKKVKLWKVYWRWEILKELPFIFKTHHDFTYWLMLWMMGNYSLPWIFFITNISTTCSSFLFFLSLVRIFFISRKCFPDKERKKLHASFYVQQEFINTKSETDQMTLVCSIFCSQFENLYKNNQYEEIF